MPRKPTKGPAPKDASKAKSRKPSKAAPAQAVSGKPVQKRPPGHQTSYTPELADEILLRLSDGETLPSICRDDHIPARTSVIQWVIDDRDGFADRYHRARELQRDSWADDIVTISDDGTNDWMERAGKDGETKLVYNRDSVDRSKLRVASRQWLMKVGSPQKYGDKVENTHKGDAAFLAVWSQMGGGASKGKTGS